MDKIALYKYLNDNESKKIKKTKKFDKHEKNRKNKTRVDIQYLIKALLTWIVGASISLMPIFTNISLNPEIENANILCILENMLSDNDVYLVITTLMISVVLELVFSGKSNCINYIFISVGIILIVYSVYWFSLLQDRKITITVSSYAGAIMFCICVVCSIMGYFNLSLKRGEK